MSRAVMTGDFMPHKAALACFKAYVDCSAEELSELGMTRDDCLYLARQYIGEGYEDTALSTMFDQIAKAFKAGKDR